MKSLKDHFYFKVGTYWVYEEETTGQLDSQWVSQSMLSTDACDFDYDINSSLHDYDINIWSDLLTSAKGCGLVPIENTTAYIKRNKSKAGDYAGQSVLAIFPYEVGDSIANQGGGAGNYNSILKTNSILHSYEEYNNVVEVSDKYNIIENDQSTRSFYAKNIGLIKKELIDSNQVWNLIRYHINQ
jgi:hypothetical protein